MRHVTGDAPRNQVFWFRQPLPEPILQTIAATRKITWAPSNSSSANGTIQKPGEHTHGNLITQSYCVDTRYFCKLSQLPANRSSAESLQEDGGFVSETPNRLSTICVRVQKISPGKFAVIERPPLRPLQTQDILRSSRVFLFSE